MRSYYHITPLLLIPCLALSQEVQNTEAMLLSPNIAANTMVQSLTNESSHLKANGTPRTIEFPTQVIRMSSPIVNRNIYCEQVNDEIDNVFINKISQEQFSYTIYTSCTFDPQTKYATKFTIDSYFDPLTDEAIDYLKSYLITYNGTNLLGSPLKIESAKALIIALTISAGTKKHPNKPPFIEFRQDHSNFYFKSNYEMKNKLFTDVSERFFSNDPQKILPFLDQWIFDYAGLVYQLVLKDSNYVELQPERIFLMDSGDALYVHRLKYYFVNHCEEYDNHRCLQPSAID